MYDNYCKKLSGDKQILARIIKAFVSEAISLSVEDIETLVGDVHIGDFPIKSHLLYIFDNEDIILSVYTLYKVPVNPRNEKSFRFFILKQKTYTYDKYKSPM